MTPSVGRTVHYVSAGSKDGTYPSTCRAAIVTEVSTDSRVSLAVLNPTGMHFIIDAQYSEDTSVPLTWHWPERVP